VYQKRAHGRFRHAGLATQLKPAAMPDMNVALRANPSGRLLPGVLKVLWAARRIRRMLSARVLAGRDGAVSAGPLARRATDKLPELLAPAWRASCESTARDTGWTAATGIEQGTALTAAACGSAGWL
jgi:hypothetical protein